MGLAKVVTGREASVRKRYSAEFKAQVVREVLREEKTFGQLSAEYGVHANLLYKWRDAALAGLPGLFSGEAAQRQAEKEAAQARQLEELYAEIGKLTTQLRWLEKKSGGRYEP